VAAQPWIERATVTKRFPDGLACASCERKAVALFREATASGGSDPKDLIARYDPRRDPNGIRDSLRASAALSRKPWDFSKTSAPRVPSTVASLSEIASLPDGGFGMMDAIFRKPVRVLRADAPEKIRALLEARVSSRVAGGRHGPSISGLPIASFSSAPTAQGIVSDGKRVALMSKPESFLVACDIGTSKICVLIGSRTPRPPRRHRQGRGANRGTRKGNIINVDATIEAIKRAAEEAEIMAGVQISRAWVGISGRTSAPSTAGASWPCRGKDREITKEDVARVIDAARGVQIPQDHEVVHVVPRDFRGRRQDGVAGPRGDDREPPRGGRPRRDGARGGHAEHRDVHEQGGHRGRASSSSSSSPPPRRC
jgi:hypothetical protein